jgi:hypothetical protein
LNVTLCRSTAIRRRFEMANAVGISRQIGEHGLRARERTLGVDEPALLAERREECRERLRIDKMRVCAEELQAARLVCRQKLLQH